nr:hypothetical protein [uncultured Oscillibacter sp.]
MQHKYQNSHFIPLKKFSLFFRHYAFVDTKEYLADQLFIQEKVRVYFGQEAHRADSKYCMIFCKIKKSDEKAFLIALQKLPSKMLLCGHTDYLDFCRNFQKLFHPLQKGEDFHGQIYSTEKAK